MARRSTAPRRARSRRCSWGRATQKALGGGRTRLYLHVFDWPEDGVLDVPGILNDAAGAYLLNDPSVPSLAVTRSGDALRISLPRGAPPDAIDTVVVLDVIGRPDVTIPPSISAETPIFVDRLEVRITSDRDTIELRFTVDGSEPNAQSAVVSGPLLLTDTTTVKARAFRSGRPVSGTSQSTYTRVAPRAATKPGALAPGLHYDLVEGDFKVLPDFAPATIVKSGAVADIDLTPRRRELQWAIRFRGLIRVPSTGVYRFYVRSDDGSRLWIDERPVVDNDGLHSAHEEAGVVALEAGLHSITVAMFEQSGGFELEAGWSGPGFARQRLPPGVLFRAVSGVQKEDRP